MGNSASRVDSSGPSSRRGRALKLNGSHSLMRSFPGFSSIGDPSLPNCSPTCNQASQIRRPTAVDEGVVVLQTGSQQLINSQEIVCIVDPRRRIRPEITHEITTYGRFLPATALSGCQMTLKGVLLLLSFLIQWTKHSQI